MEMELPNKTRIKIWNEDLILIEEFAKEAVISERVNGKWKVIRRIKKPPGIFETLDGSAFG